MTSAPTDYSIKRNIINGVVGRWDEDDKHRTYVDPADPDLIYPSVTAVLGATHSLQHILTPWASRSSAQFVADNEEEFRRRLAEDANEAVKWVNAEATRIRDLKREIGSHQHHILEALLLDVPIPDCPEHLVGIEIDGEAVDQDAISDGLLNFLTDYDPTIEMAEAEVANTNHNYAGTLDLAGWFPTIRIPGAAHKGARLVVDLKTGKTMGETAQPQIVSYKRATEVWVDKLGNKVDMPQVDMAAVLHLRRSYKGGYKLHIVQPEHEEFRWQQFLASLELYRLQQDAEGKPMQVFYPPKGDGSQPLPMIEDVKELARWTKPFASAGIENVAQLVDFSSGEISCIKRVGPKAVAACIEVLARYDLALQSEVA